MIKHDYKDMDKDISRRNFRVDVINMVIWIIYCSALILMFWFSI